MVWTRKYAFLFAVLCLVDSIMTLAALLLAASYHSNRMTAQETKRAILPVTSYGTPDVRGPDILPQIYALYLDGSGRKSLLPKDTTAFDPDLSPDGKRIAFVTSNGEEERTDKHAWVLAVMNADGSGRKRLTETKSTAERLLAPSWSADGKKIAFCTIGWGIGKTGPVMPFPPRICTIDADGRNLKRLEKLNGVDPAWSPDGKQLLFTCLGKDLQAGLCVADADGSNVRSLLKQKDFQMVTGAWSPDGKLLAYAVHIADPGRRENEGRNEAGLFLARADGTQPKRLAGGPNEFAYGIKWSGDSKRLYFARREPGGLFDEKEPAQGRRWSPSAVYAIDIDGKNLRRLTTGKERESVGGNLLFGVGLLTSAALP